MCLLVWIMWATSGNRLLEIPAVVKSLPRLSTLDLSGNVLRNLAREADFLASIEDVRWEANPVDEEGPLRDRIRQLKASRGASWL